MRCAGSSSWPKQFEVQPRLTGAVLLELANERQELVPLQPLEALVGNQRRLGLG